MFSGGFFVGLGGILQKECVGWILETRIISIESHCVKSAGIQSFSGPCFPPFNIFY